MTKRARPDFRAFDEAWATLTREEREEAERLLLRYLELVRRIARRRCAELHARDKHASLTPPEEPRTLVL
jgi:DNA-directed RNA polymerase specialized sigma subunit